MLAISLTYEVSALLGEPRLLSSGRRFLVIACSISINSIAPVHLVSGPIARREVTCQMKA